MTDLAGTEIPALVQQAHAAAGRVGFPVARDEPGHSRGSASLPGTGRVLAMLAAGCTGGSIAELGTGTGIGSAWLAAGMPADCTLVTAEIDPVRAAAAAEVLGSDGRVRVLSGDWAALLPPLGPYDLIFCDSGVRDAVTFSGLVDLLKPGGRIVMDDVTPVLALPADSPFRYADPKRELFAGESRLVWTELVLPDLANSLLVGTRK
ncbi:MAG TPA: class I SAM-dependent methyltransferase [Streptosporangiaceae bacterium]|nr:class I SAM-dependent methyltransferase [Streptosporangiaceae bacterium]